jgi:hypothetical protein
MITFKFTDYPNFEFYDYSEFKQLYKKSNNFYKILKQDNVLIIKKIGKKFIESDWVDDFVNFIKIMKEADQRSFEDEAEKIIKEGQKNNPPV